MANLKAPVRVYRTFPKVGRHVHYIDTPEGNPRNGEGSFIRLNCGDIMHVYSRYVGHDYHDDCRAEIAGIISHDGRDYLVVVLSSYPGEDDTFFLAEDLISALWNARGDLAA